MTAESAEAYQRRLAAVSEGFCPDHLAALADGGWCPHCEAWWSIDRQTMHIVTRYPTIQGPFEVLP